MWSDFYVFRVHWGVEKNCYGIIIVLVNHNSQYLFFSIAIVNYWLGTLTIGNPGTTFIWTSLLFSTKVSKKLEYRTTRFIVERNLYFNTCLALILAIIFHFNIWLPFRSFLMSRLPIQKHQNFSARLNH